MTVLTQIPVVNSPKRYDYYVEKTSTNSQPQEDGDATLVISEFDDYIFFDMDFTNTGNTSDVDLTGVGDVFLTFFDGDLQIKIKNLDYIKNIEKSLGQVVFKITTAESKRIRKLKNKYFFISTKVSTVNGESQESCLFSGIWQGYDETPRVTYKESIRTMEAQAKVIEDEKNLKLEILKTKQALLRDKIEGNSKISIDIQSTRSAIDELTIKVNELEAKIANSPKPIAKDEIPPIDAVNNNPALDTINLKLNDSIKLTEAAPASVVSFISENSTVSFVDSAIGVQTININ
jgi:hypothetical protein